ncbi:hypothetical protein JX266_002615 [Neoarthrinium moseri]|uniref:uncharacterized protein n=1 Tax=Neoarthrinium moseri TaxID=1658444 RepID=UPI001FDC51B3|nr:uncharacterized protein JN550_005052 [Neoarthrinium moseri]KAI1852437.1 hypothetical protein JX266_002615 [Neoarthrinium moseri]KAI1870509.1 hypothetical protein JN550_005052 [Neoarthrinium moseri]
MVKFTPPDPRKVLPSRADPEHRSKRKELEKKHGYGYTEPLVLAMLGVGLVWNIENQVSKHEKRKEEEEEREKQREERRRRRRDDHGRSSTWDVRDGDRSDRSDRGSSRYDYRDDHRDDPRDYKYDTRDHRDEPRRLEFRDQEYRRYRDEYKDYRNDYRYADRRDGSVRRSNRRDSF